MNKKNIIFDCDGVLVDSEVLAAQVFSDTLKSVGVDFSPRNCKKSFKGQSLHYCYAFIKNNFGVDLPDDFDATLQANTKIEFEKNLTLVDGIIPVLDTLIKNNISYCVASNGSHKKINNSFRAVGLDSYFLDNIYSAHDVAHGKPQPDLFLHAAQSMAFLPEQTCVIEDSVAGIEAAKAAGIMSVYYCADKEESLLLSEDNQPDIEIYTMQDVLSIVGL